MGSLKKWYWVLILQLKDLRADQWEEPCIRINTRELNRELYTECYKTSVWTDFGRVRVRTDIGQ